MVPQSTRQGYATVLPGRPPSGRCGMTQGSDSGPTIWVCPEYEAENCAAVLAASKTPGRLACIRHGEPLKEARMVRLDE